MLSKTNLVYCTVVKCLKISGMSGMGMGLYKMEMKLSLIVLSTANLKSIKMFVKKKKRSKFFSSIDEGKHLEG